MHSSSKDVTLAEVKLHNKPDDLWIVIENKVYDVTNFRNKHPGGEDLLDSVAGTDATKEFIEVGHSEDARKIMEKYYIGNLTECDVERDVQRSLNHVGESTPANESSKQCCTLT